MQSIVQLFRTVADLVILVIYVAAGTFAGMAIGAAYLLLGAQAHGGLEQLTPADFASAQNVSIVAALALALLGLFNGLRRMRAGQSRNKTVNISTVSRETI